jgi:leucine dehydrogenase
VLDARTIPQLGCPVVRGGANNPLADPHEDAWRCHARGILYVPDFLANAGAVIEGASRALDEADLIEGRMDAVADRVRDVVARARSERVPPLEVAVRDADARILGA